MDVTADEDYRENIMAIDVRSSTIAVFDRIILCQLIIDYMEELEDEDGTQEFKAHLIDLLSEPWKVGELDETNCIGHVLTKFESHALACLYWPALQELYHAALPASVVESLYVADSTFEQIFRSAQEMNFDLLETTLSVTDGFEQMAAYEELDGLDSDAQESRDVVLAILSKIPSAEGRLQKTEGEDGQRDGFIANSPCPWNVRLRMSI